jgi:chemotaxis-related protein WspB
MRAFVFVAADARYALDAAAVQAVHPLVNARPVAGAPPWLRGVIDVHGEMVPLVDACTLAGGGHVAPTLGARVLLLDTGAAPGRVRGRFALAVDRVLDPVEIDMDGAWAGGGLQPWLGAVVAHEGHAAQIMDPAALAAAHPQLEARPATDADPGEPGARRPIPSFTARAPGIEDLR